MKKKVPVSRLLELIEGQSEWDVDVMEELGISRRAIEIANDVGAMDELANAVLAECMMTIKDEKAESAGLAPDKAMDMALRAASKVKGNGGDGATAIQINLGGFDIGRVV